MAAAYGSIAALKASMTSPQWLTMRVAERLQAHGVLLHHVQNSATLNGVHSLVVDMSALRQCHDIASNNALHTTASDGKAVPLICALIKESVDRTAVDSADTGGYSTRCSTPTASNTAEQSC